MKTQTTQQRFYVRWFRRICKSLLVLFFVYLLVLLVGLIPVNNDFEPTNDGITVYVVSNAVHAEVIVPKTTDVVDWADRFSQVGFRGPVEDKTHVAFGWGDRGFFLETPTWDDFKVSVAAKALFVPSGSCMHVSFTKPQSYTDPVAVTISQEQYRKLVQFIDDSFVRDSTGAPIQVAGYAYSTNDAFFEAQGRYHLLNTCNSWAGRALNSAGVRVPWFSPMPKTPMLYVD